MVAILVSIAAGGVSGAHAHELTTSPWRFQDPPLPQATPDLTERTEATPAAQAEPRAKINPFDRDITITAPLQFNHRILGEVSVLLTRDDRFFVDSEQFLATVGPLLTSDALERLRGAIGSRTSFESDGIADAGIWLNYDPSQLALLVIRIDPANRVVESLYQEGRPEATGAQSADFSAYLNTNMVLTHRHAENETLAPGIFLDGAMRYRDWVFEAEFQGREDSFTDSYRVERRFARLIYDEPEKFRRWQFGDLAPETRGRQGFLELGGIGVVRQRETFQGFRNNVLQAGRQLLLQEASTIRVLRNGALQREFRLDPGQYDISNLPLDVGSNDVRLEILGESGRSEQVSYRAYLDAVDLQPGDYEYGAYFGMASRTPFGGRDYKDGELAFTGFYRKAFVDKPAVGLGLQLTEDIQNVSGQTQFILNNASRLSLDASASRDGDRVGYAYAAAYDFVVDAGDTYSSWTVVVDYTSADYANFGSSGFENPVSWVVSAGYSQRLSQDWTVSANASYRVSRSDALDDAYSWGVTANYRASREWTLRLGLEGADYGNRFGGRAEGVGANIALVWQPTFDRRVEADYSSVRDQATLRYHQASSGRVGSTGYSLTSSYNDGAGSLSGQIDHVGNRFEASLAHIAYGNDFGSITDEQITTVRVGSSLATVGGQVGIGRPIYDSFALAYPHRSLGKREVVTGDSLQGGDYIARSGPLGAAVHNRLSSFVNQSVRYDVIDPPAGYNVGDGALRVHPSYRSGFAIEVGRADFVSATGRLVDPGGLSVALVSGRVRPVDEPLAKPDLFFTNSVGRFAVQNLQPGRSYIVELFTDEAVSFEFSVPADNEGLLDLRVINVPVKVADQ